MTQTYVFKSKVLHEVLCPEVHKNGFKKKKKKVWVQVWQVYTRPTQAPRPRCPAANADEVTERRWVWLIGDAVLKDVDAL